MFGGAKPTFGAGAGATNFGSFSNTATTTPFGQSAFGKPATPAFGAAPAFGAQPAAPSMFGSPAAQAQPTGLFGTPSTSAAFGGTTTTGSTFGGFAQPQQTSNIFGAAQPAPNTTLFGQTAAPAFGAAKPGGLGLTAFGQTPAAQPTTSMFGQAAAATSTSGFGAFGQAAPTTTNVFGSGTASAFGQPQQSVVGAQGINPGSSVVKYQPTIGTDTLMKSGQPNNVNTKQHCITAMKEYEIKSLEELRMEDYFAGRKGPQAGTAPGAFGFGSSPAQAQPAATGLFGATAQPATGLFGQTAGTENKGLFGQSAFGQPAATNAFGAPAQQNNFLQKPFGAATTTAFGTTTTDASNPFGAKPAFGQSTGLFGQTPATSAAPAFGQTNTGFGTFGATAGTQQTSLFGTTNAADPNKPAFGLGSTAPAANTGFGNFAAPATSTAGGGLFGAKPASSFAAPAFGTTTAPNTGFGNFSTLGNTTGGGLFNSNLNKPATSTFSGFGTQTSAAPLNFIAGNTNNSLFSNPAKPGGLFGGTGTLGTGTAPAIGGLFGTGGSTFGTGTALGGFGSLGGNNMMSGGLGTNQLQQQPTVPIHQQILAKVTSPYGDTPIFKDLKRSDEADATRATNPAAQQAILDMNSNPYKISSKENSGALKTAPLGGSVIRKSLFDGLEEFDGSVEGFHLKPNSKRLVIKPNKNLTTAGNNTSSNNNTPVSSSRPMLGSPARESFGASLPKERPNTSPINNVASTTTTSGNNNNNNDNDTTRRESWLHPNNLEKVRQQNLQSELDNASPLNSTLTELVPRKPLDTYRPTSTVRLSVSNIPENPFEDQPSAIARRETVVTFEGDATNESALTNRSNASQEEPLAITDADYEPHPTGIVLTRVGYYTLPSLDDLKSFLAEDGSCIVPNFTVGREGYGNVYFGKEMDVAGINLDEIVHFRNKEVIIYPDDNNKPPIGSGLNREGQVTLDQVWPHDKTKHEPIKDPQRLAQMDWEGKLRRVCDKNDTRFIDYRPETGSWVFRVKHFSKYGLNDSDEEDCEAPIDPKKAKMGTAIEGQRLVTPIDKFNASTQQRNDSKLSESASKAIAAEVANGFRPMDDSAEFMLMDKTQFFQGNAASGFSMFEPQQQQQPQHRTLTSPTAMLAEEVLSNGAHKVQIMKSSLFMDIDEDSTENKLRTQNYGLRNPEFRNGDNLDSNAWKEIAPSDSSSQYDFGGRDSTGLPVSSSASVASFLRDAQSEEGSSVATERTFVPKSVKQSLPAVKPFKFDLRPSIAPRKIFATTVPLTSSITKELSCNWIADLGFYRGRSFKISFGPQNVLVVPNTYNNLRALDDENPSHIPVERMLEPRGAHDFSANLLQLIQFGSVNSYGNFKESIVPHLEVELRNSIGIDVEGSECPHLQAYSGAQLIAQHMNESLKLADLSKRESYAVSVWSLVLALWGDQEQLLGHDPKSHFVVKLRRNMLSEWLENTLSKRLGSVKGSDNSYLNHVLNLLYSHRVKEACDLAINYDDVNLALTLSQLSSGPAVRLLVEEQLHAWQKSKSDKHISLERLKMYMLAAGRPIMQSSHGPINLMEDRDWITVLALQLWYFTMPTTSITDAVIAYDSAFNSDECFADAPKPEYGNPPYNTNKPTYDLRYHLLQLYSKRSYPLETLLNPITHTSDSMDFRLSWLLLQSLEALGYKHSLPLSEAQMHVDFANQLEHEGLWHWAIFVLLHIKEQNQRERAVQNTLQRFVTVSARTALSEEEHFIVHRLGVPEHWVDYAKALRAGANGQRHLQAKYLLRAQHWVTAHEIIFQYIAPDAIINSNTEYLRNLLIQFESTDQNTNIRVPNWANQGQIFLDFIDISGKFEKIRNMNNLNDIHARWENMKPQLNELVARISLLPCPTSKHRLCQSEISQSLSYLVQGTCLVYPALEQSAVLQMAIERLPLPQESSTKDLRSLLDELLEKIENDAKSDGGGGHPSKNTTTQLERMIEV